MTLKKFMFELKSYIHCFFSKKVQHYELRGYGIAEKGKDPINWTYNQLN